MNKQFTYTTQGTQSRTELRKHLKAVLRELINQEFTNQQTGISARLTQRDINKISSREATKQSEANGYTKEEHFKVAEDIAPLYENATLKEQHTDYKKNPNIANIYRFNIDIEVNSKDTTAKITAFERVEGTNRIYTIELQGLNPLPFSSRAQEAEAAKSLSKNDAAPHNDPSNIATPISNTTTKNNQSQAMESKPKIRRNK